MANPTHDVKRATSFALEHWGNADPNDELGNLARAFLAPDEARAENERLREALAVCAKAVPELAVNRDRYICLCGAGSDKPGDINHYAHCAILNAQRVLAATEEKTSEPPAG